MAQSDHCSKEISATYVYRASNQLSGALFLNMSHKQEITRYMRKTSGNSGKTEKNLTVEKTACVTEANVKNCH